MVDANGVATQVAPGQAAIPLPTGGMAPTTILNLALSAGGPIIMVCPTADMNPSTTISMGQGTSMTWMSRTAYVTAVGGTAEVWIAPGANPYFSAYAIAANLSVFSILTTSNTQYLSTIAGVSSFPYNAPYIAGNGPYETVNVVLGAQSNSNSATYGVRIAVKSAIGNIRYSQWQTARILRDDGISGQPQYGRASLYFPLTVNVGEQIRYDIVLIAGVALPLTVDLFALGGQYQPYPLRSDGRNYPRGDFAVSFPYNAASVPIPAPGDGLKILIRSLTPPNMYSNVAGYDAYVYGVVNGVTPILLTSCLGFQNVIPATTTVNIPEGGMLLDDNTAVTVATPNPAGVGLNGNITYDLTP